MTSGHRQISVAFVIDKYLPFIGGAERQAQLLARLLSSRLGHCEVLTAQSNAVSDVPAVRVRRIGTARHHPLRHFINFAVGWGEVATRGHRYSVVHGHALSALACGAALAARPRGCAALLKVCSVGPQGDLAKLTSHSFGRWVWPMVRQLAMFIVPTPGVVPELLQAGIASDRVAVIPNAVATADVATVTSASKRAARAALGLPDRPTVLYAGRLSPEKGPDILMRAWDRVAAECDATLVILGTGPEAPRVVAWVDAGHHAGRVHCVGPRHDVERYYRAADVLAAPSRSETFGNTVAEAMAHGLAVVTTPVGLAAHWLEHARNALLVTDESEMADALRRLIADADLRGRLGLAAREVAVAAFSAESIVDRYLDLYGQLTAPAALPVTA